MVTKPWFCFGDFVLSRPRQCGYCEPRVVGDLYCFTLVAQHKWSFLSFSLEMCGLVDTLGFAPGGMGWGEAVRTTNLPCL